MEMAKNSYQVDNIAVTWIMFEKQLLARFDPIEFEDYDKSLS